MRKGEVKLLIIDQFTGKSTLSLEKALVGSRYALTDRGADECG